jgi:hypothetical protein
MASNIMADDDSERSAKIVSLLKKVREWMERSLS